MMFVIMAKETKNECVEVHFFENGVADGIHNYLFLIMPFYIYGCRLLLTNEQFRESATMLL